MDEATRGLAQQRGRHAVAMRLRAGLAGNAARGRATSPPVTFVDQPRMIPRERLQAPGKRQGTGTAQRVQRQFSPHPSPVTLGDSAMVVNGQRGSSAKNASWEHWVERSSRAAALLLSRVDNVLSKVDSALVAAAADQASFQTRTSRGVDSLSTEKMEVLADRLATLEAVLDNAAQRRALGFSSVMSPIPVAAKPPPIPQVILPAANSFVESWTQPSGTGTPRCLSSSQQITPRVSLRLQPTQRHVRHLSEPRGMMGSIPRTASSRSASRSCSPHPPLQAVGAVPQTSRTISLSAPNSMILPLVVCPSAVSSPPVGGVMPFLQPPMAHISLANPPQPTLLAGVASLAGPPSPEKDDVVGKIRNWLGTIPIGNGAERGWDDTQVESIGSFALEHNLNHLAAEDIYRQYVEHHLENAAD